LGLQVEIILATPSGVTEQITMKYEVIKNGCGKDGRSFDCGVIVELDAEYAEHLIKRGVLAKVSGGKKKERAVATPIDLEDATE